MIMTCNKKSESPLEEYATLLGSKTMGSAPESHPEIALDARAQVARAAQRVELAGPGAAEDQVPGFALLEREMPAGMQHERPQEVAPAGQQVCQPATRSLHHCWRLRSLQSADH